MEYNTQRSQIVIPEYGRNIHKMINHAFTIENREERNTVAHSIVKVMGQVKPQFKEADDFVQRLWDHMIIISDFKLDVDSPYPYPEKEELQKKPGKMKYPATRIRFRHYGKAVESFIKKAIAMEDGEEKDSFTYYIANVMKKNYLMYNRDSVNDQLILDQLSLLSNGELALKETYTLQKTSDLITRTKPSTTKGSQRKNTTSAYKKGKKTFRKNNR
tara:strand:+ start:1200 stop:1847 length:648 start_codon:yes stop_codon:yes gene_type:complete